MDRVVDTKEGASKPLKQDDSRDPRWVRLESEMRKNLKRRKEQMRAKETKKSQAP